MVGDPGRVGCFPRCPQISHRVSTARGLLLPCGGEEWLKVALPPACVPVSVLRRKPEGIFMSMQKNQKEKKKKENRKVAALK